MIKTKDMKTNKEILDISKTLLQLLANATGAEFEDEKLAVEIIAKTIEKTKPILYEAACDAIASKIDESKPLPSDEEIENEAVKYSNNSQFKSDFPHDWHSVYDGFKACARWMRDKYQPQTKEVEPHNN